MKLIFRSSPRATTDTGDRFGELLAAQARALERVAASYTRTASERDVLLQDIAMALWTALPTFRGECSERTFVLRIAHNRALAHLSRRGAHGSLRAPVDVADHEDAVVATTGKNPAMAYERAERGSRLLAATRALPITHRQVITLLLEGLGHREIADVLGITEGNVAVRATRARAALRALLEEDGSGGNA